MQAYLINLDSTKTNVHHTSSSETNTVNNIKNILNEHNTYDDVLNGTLVMGNRYLFKNGGNYNTGVQVMRLMNLQKDEDEELMQLEGNALSSYEDSNYGAAVPLSSYIMFI